MKDQSNWILLFISSGKGCCPQAVSASSHPHTFHRILLSFTRKNIHGLKLLSRLLLV